MFNTWLRSGGYYDLQHNGAYRLDTSASSIGGHAESDEDHGLRPAHHTIE